MVHKGNGSTQGRKKCCGYGVKERGLRGGGREGKGEEGRMQGGSKRADFKHGHESFIAILGLMSLKLH